MLEELLKYDRLANKDELLFLLFKALPLSNNQKISDLKRYCTSNYFSIGRCFDGTLKLLEFMSYVRVSEGLVSINEDLFEPSEIECQSEYFGNDGFVRNLLLSIAREMPITDFIIPDAVRRDINTGLFYIKENLIPLRYFGIRNLLIALDFLQRDSTFDPNNLFVRESSTILFDGMILNPLREANQRRARKVSLSELSDRIERQEELGSQAEIFVLEFERDRLKGHLSITDVRRVSEEFTNAGYDIESFNNLDSVLIDRYVEVKSYSEKLLFYWSRNEVETAKALADKYFLYLVDRNKIGIPDYTPKIFQNPYLRIFNNELWEKAPETWAISISETDLPPKNSHTMT